MILAVANLQRTSSAKASQGSSAKSSMKLKNQIMDENDRVPLGIYVVLITTLVSCFALVIIGSFLISSFGDIEDDCYAAGENGTFFEAIFKSHLSNTNQRETEKKENYSWYRWLKMLQTTPENCEKILKPIMGTLIAAVVIWVILAICCCLAYIAMREGRPEFLIPFMVWMMVVVLFTVVSIIVVVSRLYSRSASVFVVCTFIYLFLPIYYWIIVVRYYRQTKAAIDQTNDGEQGSDINSVDGSQE